MKGKKTDPAFVAKFISECAQEGRDTPEKIVSRAKQMIAGIDEEIRAIEAKKLLRSKLLDVIVTFEKPTKDKTEDARLLSFFTLEYPEVCRYLCEVIKKQPIPADARKYSTTNDPKNIFAVKQLLECKIIARSGDELVCGERFDEYMKFVLREDK